MQFFFIPLIIVICLPAGAQIVDKCSSSTFQLADKTTVTVFRGFNDEGIHTYYYLPSHLRLSVRKDNTPEFSFTSFTTADGKEKEEAILHMLLVWGLTAVQEKEVETRLQMQVDSNAVLAGVISLENPANTPSFLIKGENPLAQVLNTKWSQEPVASVLPGTKMALSYRLNANETKLFEEAMRKPDGFDKISVELVYTYKGGNRTSWYNLIKGDNYIMKEELKNILNPVLKNQRK